MIPFTAASRYGRGAVYDREKLKAHSPKSVEAEKRVELFTFASAVLAGIRAISMRRTSSSTFHLSLVHSDIFNLHNTPRRRFLTFEARGTVNCFARRQVCRRVLGELSRREREKKSSNLFTWYMRARYFCCPFPLCN